MEQLPLWFDTQQKRYYYVGPIICDRCREKVRDNIIIRQYWKKKNSHTALLCVRCFNKQKDFGIVEEIRGAKVVIKTPLHCRPVLTKPPSVSDGRNQTIFSMAEKNYEGEQVNDQTVFAGRECLEGASIGLSPAESEALALQEEAVGEFLEWAKNPSSHITHDEKKQIGSSNPEDDNQ